MKYSIFRILLISIAITLPTASHAKQEKSTKALQHVVSNLIEKGANHGRCNAASKLSQKLIEKTGSSPDQILEEIEQACADLSTHDSDTADSDESLPVNGCIRLWNNLVEKGVNRGRCNAINKHSDRLLTITDSAPIPLPTEIAEACSELGIDNLPAGEAPKTSNPANGYISVWNNLVSKAANHGRCHAIGVLGEQLVISTGSVPALIPTTVTESCLILGIELPANIVES